ncbi:MAG: 30S ribosomal protein S1 [Pyrinomonadaceae bacterium]
MSNDVTNTADETINNQDSVTEKTEPSAETSAEASVGAEKAPEAETNETSTDASAGGEMDFGALLAQYEQEQVDYTPGEVVSGTVVGVSDRGVLVDFGYKSEGLVATEEFTDSEGNTTVKQGDEVEVVIRAMGGDGPPALSYSDAKNRRSWDEIENAFKNDVIVKGIVIDKTKGGLKVDIGGVEAFLPGSQVDSRPVRNLDSFNGKEIEAKIVKFSRKRNNIVISRKAITDEVINEQKAETLKKVDVGYVVDGVVKNLTEYGAFIDIGGIDGLLHVTDMSWGRLNKPGDMFKVGDSVQVKILKLDREKEKVSLGFKQLLPDPWSTVAEIYPVNSKVKGKISSVTEYGAFVELESGVEGLVHVSEMSWAKRMKHPKHFVSKGDEVEVQVLGIDPEERRISLGIKQLQENPWDSIGERYQLGTKVHGKVRNLTDFGAFVEIEDGVDGLVHVSDISWSKKVKHPKDVLKKGQEVEAIITNIDTDAQRLSLSIKELTPSAWDTFTAEHKRGDVVKGKISRFAGFGVFVELAPDLEGLCHISELSDERIENPEATFQIGQELDFKILRIEQDVEKIGLSARAVGKEDEPEVDTRSYSSDAKGGMASLGELANLKIGGSKPVETDEKPAEAKEEKTESTQVEEVEDSNDSPEVVEAEAVDETVEAGSDDDSEAAPVAVAEETGESVEEEPVAEETVADEAKVEETVADEAKVEETVADEAKVEEAVGDEAKVEETVTEETSSEEIKVEEAVEATDADASSSSEAGAETEEEAAKSKKAE